VDAQAARRSRPLANGKGGEAAQISSSSMRTPSSWALGPSRAPTVCDRPRRLRPRWPIRCDGSPTGAVKNGYRPTAP